MMQSYWVFGYGSLMWRPGFPFVESRPALVRGVHRSLCVLSHVHRGTPDKPGLVLGLDRGGSCHGMAFRVAANDWPETVAYLKAREQVTLVYREARRRISFMDGSSQEAEALMFLVDRNHPQYAGKLSVREQLPLILQGHGISGHCPEYVRSTVLHLRELGVHDPQLEVLMAELVQPRALTSALDQVR